MKRAIVLIPGDEVHLILEDRHGEYEVVRVVNLINLGQQCFHEGLGKLELNEVCNLTSVPSILRDGDCSLEEGYERNMNDEPNFVAFRDQPVEEVVAS